MRLSEILRLVWLNLSQNKIKEIPEEVPAAVRLVVPAVAWISADFSDSDRRKRAKP